MERLNLNRANISPKNFVKHEGSILNISNGILTVALKGNINCEACNAKGACGVSESNAKEIQVDITDESFEINEDVEVVLEKQLGLKAVFWAYVFPFILVLCVLIISSNFLKEWVSGLLSLFILLPYYLTLYALQSSFKKAFKVTILKNSLS
jgi:sigma-E factor negative regulatory protein RseC